MNTNHRRFIRPSELENVEKFIDIHGQVLCFAAPKPPPLEVVSRGKGSLSNRFLSIAEGLGRSSITHGSLDEWITDEDAKRLWEMICEHAIQLPPVRWSVPWSTRLNTVEKLDAYETLMMIAAVMSEGMQYSTGDAHHLLGHQQRDERGGKRWLRQTSLKLTSALKALTLDFRNPVWLAKRSLNGRLRVLCRHYATILQILFYAAKRATGRFEGAHVISAIGVPWFGSPFGHAWSWFVRKDSCKVIALDLTLADSALDRGRATSIMNPGLDATRWTNASSFVMRLFFEYLVEGSSLYRDARVLDALSSMVDPSTDSGQMLLFNVLRTVWIDQRLQHHLTKHLADRGFLRRVPFGDCLLPAEAGSAHRALFSRLLKDQTVFDEVLRALRGERSDSTTPRATRLERSIHVPGAGTYDPWLSSMRSVVDSYGWPTSLDDPK